MPDLIYNSGNPEMIYYIGDLVSVSISGKRTTGRVVSTEDAEHLKAEKRRGMSWRGQILIVQPDGGPYVRVNADCVED